MFVLNGVQLPDGLEWDRRFQSNGVANTFVRTVGGGLVVYSQQLYSGVQFSLVASQVSGWMTKAQVDSVISMANTIGAVYTLTTSDGDFQVMFDHSSGSAASFYPLQVKQNYSPDDYFSGQMNFITV